MSGEIIYDLATFELGEGGRMLAALKGSTNCYLGGALVRRWTSLAVGTAGTVRERGCELAADMEDGHLEYKPKPAIAAEAFLGVVERRLAKAVPLGQAYPSANQPRISGFRLRVSRDAMGRFEAESPAEAVRFLALRPQLRSPYETLVLEAALPATMAGLDEWRSCQSNASYVLAHVTFNGGGEV